MDTNSRFREPVHYVALAALALAAALLVACGGEPTAPSSTPQASVTAGPSPTPRPLLLSEVTPVAVELPADSPTRFTGPPLRGATDAIRSAIQGAGVSLDILTAYVLPVNDTDQSMLALSLDQAGASALPQDSKPMLAAILASPAIKAANITRITIYFSGNDEQGSYLAIMSMPTTTVAAMLEAGELNADLAKTLKIEMRRQP